MKLLEILNNCATPFKINIKNNLDVFGITTDSRNIKRNQIFGALKGKNFNGENFIKKLIKQKVNIFVINKNSKFLKEKSKQVIFISTKYVNLLVNEIAHQIYPSKINEKIAVTGTNGKTSVAEYTRQLWSINKKKSASIGTLGTIFNDKKIINSNLTTPTGIELHKTLSILSKENCSSFIIEASSIGLEQDRIFPIKFNKVGITNFSRDHLDYHKTMQKYKKAKTKLFKNYSDKECFAIINSDLKEFKYFKRICLKKKIKILDVGKNAKYLKINSIKFDGFNYITKYLFKGNLYSLTLNVTSYFEIFNMFFSLLLVFDEELSPGHFDLLKKLSNPCGRLEKIYDRKFKIFVDYAHTPDAIKSVLTSLNKIKKNKVYTIIGCGGDRDKGKRPIMTRITLNYSDVIILADDNPRNEDPKKIRSDMLKGLSETEKQRIENIGNRKKAIQFAITKLKANDILLISGKGHENYQLKKNKKKIFSDKKTALEFLEKNK